MCYTGRGRFETSMGDCTCPNYEKFKEEFGVTAYTVCGWYPFDPEEYEKRNELYTEEEFDELAKKARELKLVW